jgi:hypothetical protein
VRFDTRLKALESRPQQDTALAERLARSEARGRAYDLERGIVREPRAALEFPPELRTAGLAERLCWALKQRDS